MPKTKIYKSHVPRTYIPEESIFTHLFVTRFNAAPHYSPAFIDGITGRLITRQQLRDFSLELAHGLRNEFSQHLGGTPLERGDTVMIFSPNSICWPIAMYGSQAAGLRTTFANSSYTPRELAHQWRDSGAKVVFVHPSLIPVMHETFKLLKFDAFEGAKRVIVANWGLDPELPHEDYVQVEDLLGKGAFKEEEKILGRQARTETAYLCYSAGTTGKPKGVEVRDSRA